MFTFEGIFGKSNELGEGTGRISILNEQIVFEADFEKGLFSGPVSLKIKYPRHVRHLLDNENSDDGQYFYVFENLSYRKGQLIQNPESLSLGYVEDHLVSKTPLKNDSMVQNSNLNGFGAGGDSFDMNEPIFEDKEHSNDINGDKEG